MSKTCNRTPLSWQLSTVNPRPLLSFLTLFITGTECFQLVTSSKWRSRMIQSSVMRIWLVPPSHNKLSWSPGMKKWYLKLPNPQRLLQFQSQATRLLHKLQTPQLQPIKQQFLQTPVTQQPRIKLHRIGLKATLQAFPPQRQILQHLLKVLLKHQSQPPKSW